MGVTWTKNTTPITHFGSAAVNGKMFFRDINNGIILGTLDSGATYKIYTTSNGGAIWSAGTAYTQPYTNLSYVPGTTTLAGTGATGSGYSNDNGATWKSIDTGVLRTSVSFLTGVTGWAGGFTTSPFVGGIYKYSGAALSVADFNSKKQITATPNPTNGMIQLRGTSISEVSVFDILGKQVYNSKFSALNEVNLDLSKLQTGSYLLKATNDIGATQTIKIMKN